MKVLNSENIKILTAATEDKKGIYISFLTTSLLQSIYKPKNHKTKVNHLDNIVRIKIDNFKKRSKYYYDNFGSDFIFTPIFILENNQEILSVEKKILRQLNKNLNVKVKQENGLTIL